MEGQWHLQRETALISAVHRVVALLPTASVSKEKYKDNFQRGNFLLSIYSHRKMQHDFPFLISMKISLQSSAYLQLLAVLSFTYYTGNVTGKYRWYVQSIQYSSEGHGYLFHPG